jgi:hypothetical protein
MPDFRITIELVDVSGDQTDELAKEIEDDYGQDFGINDGDFIVRISQKVGQNYFGRDPGDDVIQT